MERGVGSYVAAVGGVGQRLLNAALAAGRGALPFRDIGDGACLTFLALHAAGAETAKAACWGASEGANAMWVWDWRPAVC